jgi:hypothetical protein
MGWTTYKNGIKTTTDTVTGDAGLAIAQNFVALGDLFDSVPLLDAGNLTIGSIADAGSLTLQTNLASASIKIQHFGFAPYATQGIADLLFFNNHSVATWLNVLDNGSGDMSISGTLSTANNTFDDGSGKMLLLGGELSIFNNGPYSAISANNGLYLGNQIFTSGGSTLDDGGGNMVVAGQITVNNGIIGNTLAWDQYLNLHFQVGGNQWSIHDENAGSAILFYVNSSIYTNPNSVGTLHNILDNGSGAMTVVSISGNGASLTSLNGTNIASGTVANARLPSAISVTTLQGAYISPMLTKATSYTLGASDSVVYMTATGQTMTLPSAATTTGREYTIKMVASGSCTVATTSSQNIDASTTYSLSAQWKYVTVVSNGTQWYVVANN